MIGVASSENYPSGATELWILVCLLFRYKPKDLLLKGSPKEQEQWKEAKIRVTN